MLFLFQFKQRCYDISMQEWYSEINKSSKLRTYCKFKHSLKCEKYLTCVENSIFRKALSRFRLSSHDLHIEKGRELGIPPEQRVCPFNCNCIEDEYHFALECPKYENCDF